MGTPANKVQRKAWKLEYPSIFKGVIMATPSGTCNAITMAKLLPNLG